MKIRRMRQVDLFSKIILFWQVVKSQKKNVLNGRIFLREKF
jgi:hypothetical protein